MPGPARLSEENREDDPRWLHAHMGWASDIGGVAGMNAYQPRQHEAKDQVLFSARSKILANPFPPGWRPVNWNGGETRELMNGSAHPTGRFQRQRGRAPRRHAPNETAREAAAWCPISPETVRDESSAWARAASWSSPTSNPPPAAADPHPDRQYALAGPQHGSGTSPISSTAVAADSGFSPLLRPPRPARNPAKAAEARDTVFYASHVPLDHFHRSLVIRYSPSLSRATHSTRATSEAAH